MAINSVQKKQHYETVLKLLSATSDARALQKKSSLTILLYLVVENNSWIFFHFSHNLSLLSLAYATAYWRGFVYAQPSKHLQWPQLLTHPLGPGPYDSVALTGAAPSTVMHNAAQLQSSWKWGLGEGSRQWFVTSSFCLSSFPTVTLRAGFLRREAEGVKKKIHVSFPLLLRESSHSTGSGSFCSSSFYTSPWHQLSATCSTNNPTPKIFINADSQWKWLQIKAESVIIERVLSWMTIKRHLIREPAKTQF